MPRVRLGPPGMVRRLLAYLWASPNSIAGLLVVPPALASGGRVRLVEGVVEVHGPAVRWLLTRVVPLEGGAAALTLGHVVLGCDEHCLAVSRAHERVHVRQYERWGPLFIPAYFGSSLAARLRGRCAYRDNRFEREAYDRDRRGV